MPKAKAVIKSRTEVRKGRYRVTSVEYEDKRKRLTVIPEKLLPQFVGKQVQTAWAGPGPVWRLTSVTASWACLETKDGTERWVKPEDVCFAWYHDILCDYNRAHGTAFCAKCDAWFCPLEPDQERCGPCLGHGPRKVKRKKRKAEPVPDDVIEFFNRRDAEERAQRLTALGYTEVNGDWVRVSPENSPK